MAESTRAAPSVAQDYLPIESNVFVYARDRSTEPPGIADPAGLSTDWRLFSHNHNLVVTSGKILVARLVGEEANYNVGLAFCEVGTDTATPAIANTNIGAVTARASITRIIRSGSRVQARTFYAAADVTAHLRKTGTYGSSDATSTNQSGELFNAALIDLDNSAGTKDLTVVHEITFG